MPNVEAMLTEVLTPDEHLARAQRYANTLPTILADSTANHRANTPADIALMDVYLHAAEVHIKLRAVMLEPRVTLTHTWGATAPVEARLGHPTGHPSQMEQAGG